MNKYTITFTYLVNGEQKEETKVIEVNNDTELLNTIFSQGFDLGLNNTIKDAKITNAAKAYKPINDKM